jgi:hypothetical protein
VRERAAEGHEPGPRRCAGLRRQGRVVTSLNDLPDVIGVLGPRVTVTALRVRRSVNMLNAEALAVALLVGGAIVVTTDAPLPGSEAEDVGLEYRLLT